MEEEALAFATKAHGTQMRKYNLEPYIEHPKRVAETVRTIPHTPEMICAAYLHDVVEDTPIEIEEIKNRFGTQIGTLVSELTDEYVKGKYPHLNRRKRKELEVQRLAGISSDAKTIKLADIIDNTMDIVRNDKHFAPKYLREMEALTAVLKQGDSQLYQRAMAEIRKGREVMKGIG